MECRNIAITKNQKASLTENEEMATVNRECIKRSAESSPECGNKKRTVFCDITNARVLKDNIKPSKGKKELKVKPNGGSHVPEAMEVDESSVTSVCDGSMQSKEEADSTLYCSALDRTALVDVSMSEAPERRINLIPVPPDVEDFDKANRRDQSCEAIYAPYIFAYYRSVERRFALDKYIHRQPEVTKGMRAVLVDWMVEVQESFELNHETLYLAVKLVDFYLMKNTITKANLQLVGATAILLACKYDERIPPIVDDFLYICDDSYTRSELLSMEAKILRTMDFYLGLPLSYRFLRRYARCAKASMETLTLARYILETSLMDYELIDRPDSKMAAAALYLAMQMKKLGEWTPTLQYYSGYQADELQDLVKALNKNIAVPPNKNLLTVRTKYSHKIFFEVAKVPPLKIEN